MRRSDKKKTVVQYQSKKNANQGKRVAAIVTDEYLDSISGSTLNEANASMDYGTNSLPSTEEAPYDSVVERNVNREDNSIGADWVSEADR